MTHNIPRLHPHFKERVRSLGDDWRLSASGLMLPPSVKPKPRPMIAMDFFSGAGGFSLGLLQAGIHVVAALDNDTAATLTYTYNLGAHPMQFHYADDEAVIRLETFMEKHVIEKTKHGVKVLTSGGGYRATTHQEIPGVAHFFFGDIRKFTPQRIMDGIGIKPGELDLIVGGPPCQGFSTSGKRDVMDPRNSLVFEFAHFIVAMRPKFMVFENVPGIVSMVTPEGLPVLDVFCQILADGEYGTYESLKKSLTHNLPKTARVATAKRSRKGSVKMVGKDDADATPEQQLKLNL